jgi:hypothetical protein
MVRTASNANQPAIQKLPVILPWFKRPSPEADLSSPNTDEVKKT